MIDHAETDREMLVSPRWRKTKKNKWIHSDGIRAYPQKFSSGVTGKCPWK